MWWEGSPPILLGSCTFTLDDTGTLNFVMKSLFRGEDEELITVEPEDNSLSLVYRDKESLRSSSCGISQCIDILSPFSDTTFTLDGHVLHRQRWISIKWRQPNTIFAYDQIRSICFFTICSRFVKYVSEQAKSIGGFQDLSATYYE